MHKLLAGMAGAAVLSLALVTGAQAAPSTSVGDMVRSINSGNQSLIEEARWRRCHWHKRCNYRRCWWVRRCW